jgi:hypothetical protein
MNLEVRKRPAPPAMVILSLLVFALPATGASPNEETLKRRYDAFVES